MKAAPLALCPGRSDEIGVGLVHVPKAERLDRLLANIWGYYAFCVETFESRMWSPTESAWRYRCLLGWPKILTRTVQ